MAGRLPLMFAGASNILRAAVAASVFLVAVGCSDPEAELNERLRSEIVTVHDQAMVQTGVIFDLRMRLSGLDGAPHADRQRIEQLADALQEADRAMFAWMNQYQTLAIDDDLGVDNAYRHEQLDAIRSISRLTETAVLEAERFIAASAAAGR